MNIIQSLLLCLILIWLFQDVNPCLGQLDGLGHVQRRRRGDDGHAGMKR